MSGCDQKERNIGRNEKKRKGENEGDYSSSSTAFAERSSESMSASAAASCSSDGMWLACALPLLATSSEGQKNEKDEKAVEEYERRGESPVERRKGELTDVLSKGEFVEVKVFCIGFDARMEDPKDRRCVLSFHKTHDGNALCFFKCMNKGCGVVHCVFV